MIRSVFWLSPLLITLGACTETTTSTSSSAGITLSQGVIDMAAPNQDLSTVQILDDGCYWYRHVGPVETTMIPLRNVEGRPICARAQT
ncbi:MAG: hypothetical protein AAF665_16155 [Pseudomonadota bacterium]